MLTEEFWQVNGTWDNIEDLILMQDGAPPQFSIVNREWLNTHNPGNLMGRDLSSCEFFL